MAQRPTFPDPYLKGIDATEDNDFKCLINDKDVITDFVFTITEYIETTENDKITTTFNEVYTYSKEETEPIYGGSGNNSYLIVTVPANTLNNNETTTHTGKYKWKVSLTDSYGNTVESREYYFNCVKEAELTLTSSDITNGIVNKANAVFVGTYTCTSPLISHRFILKRNEEIIQDTGDVYSQYLYFEYDMFLPGNYSLYLTTENEGKMTAETEIAFTVEYENAVTNIIPKCQVSTDENSVIIDFSEVMTVPGTYVPNTAVYESIEITSEINGIHIPEETELFWQERSGVSDGLDIDENNFTVYVMVKLPYGRQGEIVRLSGDNEIAISFDGFTLNYQYTNGISGSVNIGEVVNANIISTEEVDNKKVYAFSLTADTTYYLTSDYKFIMQNPMNVSWWLITITPDGVTATLVEEGDEAVV